MNNRTYLPGEPRENTEPSCYGCKRLRYDGAMREYGCATYTVVIGPDSEHPLPLLDDCHTQTLCEEPRDR